MNDRLVKGASVGLRFLASSSVSRYLPGSKHVGEDRKQASIADAETHAVLPEHLKAKRQLIGARPSLLPADAFLCGTPYAAQGADVAVRPLLVVELAKARSIPNQVSLAGAARPSRKRERARLLLAGVSNNTQTLEPESKRSSRCRGFYLRGSRLNHRL